MGKEATCTVRWKGAVSEGRAQLEMPHLLFRGEFRLKIPVEGKPRVTARDGVLRVPHEGGTAEFALGGQAEKWAQAILSPKGRLEKMGLKAGMKVKVTGNGPADFLPELAAAKVEVVERGEAAYRVCFVDSKAGLEKIGPAESPVWIVYPKGIKAITELDVIGHARRVGMKDTKVCSFSPTLTALRFISRAT